MNSCCIFCRTGSEMDLANQINEKEENCQAIAPMKIMQEKRRGTWQKKEKALFPGYIFLYYNEEIDFEQIKKTPGLYKILNYDAEFKELQGSDYEYSMWIYKHQGCIETSKVLTIGRTVKVIDGPLLDGLGTIVKLDKHKRRAWVEFEFAGQLRTVTLSAECVEELPEQ